MADESGNTLGVIVARLDDVFVVKNTGSIAQNVNYAVKKSYCLAFISNNLEAAKSIQIAVSSEKMSFDQAVEKVQKATVLVVVY